MELSREEYWSGLPFPPPGNLLDSGKFLGLIFVCFLTLCLLHSWQILHCLSHQGIGLGLNYHTKHFQNQSHWTASALPEYGQHHINRPTGFLFWAPELSTEIWFSAVHCLSPNPLCSDNPKLSPLYYLNIDLLFYKNNKLSLYTLTPFLDHLVYFIFFWFCSDYIFLTVFDKLSKNWEEQQLNQATEEDVKKQVIEKETQMMYKQIWENVQLHLN